MALGALGLAGSVWCSQARAEGAVPGGSLGKIASLQNQVETRTAVAAEAWAPSTLNQALYASYRVRTGPVSRAGILYSDQTLHRLNEKSEVEIRGPVADKPGLISLLLGSHYFSSRAPKEFRRIETPVVTAAIRGTEFVVEVDGDTTTLITMIEGSLEATNSFGSLAVQGGEQAYVEPGKAPVKRIIVRPRDAVAWALYYPPVLGGADAERLQGLGDAGRALARAAALLSAGQVDQARPLIESARQGPTNPVALALSSVIAITANEKEKGLGLAEGAVKADPNSAAAALALSFAAQASFDIPRARVMAEKAAEVDPDSSVALARAAELRMAEGDLRGAEEAARKAVAKVPGESRALAVLGFVQLARFRSKEAEPLFESSTSADPASSLARIGLGLARIRGGRLAEGREEIQTAVALDPDDSLLRSYLAKAYYEERRSGEAGKELAAAKELDPSDPTPYLYDAIRKQNENRPGEALDDLRGSIERNDMRAVYRSRLLLDEDRAVRGSDLARIYNDLGFDELGLVTARRSADEDQSNYSSHLFLAGAYRMVPDFAPAFLSEVLQARIYQPASVNAARPDLVNETVSFNEYTALFDRPRARAFGGVTYGRTETEVGILGPAIRLDSSDTGSGEVSGTLNGDRYAMALGYRKLSSDGFRLNNDQDVANYRGFFEFSPTDRNSFQANVLVSRQDTGDLPLRPSVTVTSPERFDTHLRNIGLGYHRIFAPGSDLAVSLIDNRTEQTLEDLSSLPLSTGVLEGPQAEVQQVLRRRRITWVLGAGGFRGKTRILSSGPTLEADDRFTNAYGYLTLHPSRLLDLTAGASYEDVVSPTGLLSPRDSQIPTAEIEFSDSRISPKFGVTFRPHRKTTLRAALYYRLSPAIGRIQTLEPTQVAGFNQFFFEPGGTRSRTYGVGVDQEFSSHLFAGVSMMRRSRTIPQVFCDPPDSFVFSGCESISLSFGSVSAVIDRDSRDVDASAYVNALFGRRLSGALDYSFQRSRFDFTMIELTPPNFLESRIETHRARPQIRWFLPSGWYAAVIGNYFRQRVNERNTFDPSFASFIGDRKAQFWIVDVTVGYKLPGRYGSVVLEGRNVRDKEFPFFERSLEDTFVPARQVTLTFNFTL